MRSSPARKFQCEGCRTVVYVDGHTAQPDKWGEGFAWILCGDCISAMRAFLHERQDNADKGKKK